MQQMGTDEVSYCCNEYVNECTLWTLEFTALATSAVLDLFDTLIYTPSMLVYQYHIMPSHNN